jgi:serine/threonine-protein kinase
MELKSGVRLGPYEIVSPLGAGGMGEVWKALDTRLDRTVAVKVLPKYIADRDDLRARFEREARAVSSLKHPHICVLYDIGKQDDIDFMVLEHLEGETLAARVVKGPLPLDQVLKYAAQIADALDRAHRSGVCHRDVKPANIMLTRDGVKVLDFGLAKTAPRMVMPDDVTRMPEARTTEGTILGTPQYMAPEQYEGTEADARSNIFAFGCVVYEMVTGKRCFDGKTRASLIAAVLGGEPVSMSAIQPVTPAALERLVKRCLEKDPEDRYQSMRDVVLDLRSIGASGTEVKAQAKGLLHKAAWIVVAGVLAVIAAGFAIHDWRRGTQAVEPVARLTMEIAPAEALGNREFNADRPSRTAIAISPDGNTVVFSATRGSVLQLYRRALDRPEAVAMPGTEGAFGPFFSPDGQWVGFWAAGKLKKVPLGGGPASTICTPPPSLATPWGASWSSAGTIVFIEGDLMQVPAAGGTPQTLLKPDAAKGENFSTPAFLPDGKTLLFTVRSSDNWEDARIIARRLDSGAQSVLFKGGADARYVPTGHLVYMQNAVLMAVPFDARRLELTGSPVAILDGVMQAVNEPNAGAETGMGQFAISASGRLVYASGGIFPPRIDALFSVDRKGAPTELKAPRAGYGGLRISPDGQKLAVFKLAATSRAADVWVLDTSRGTSARLTSEGANFCPLWSPDGKRILFAGGADRQIMSVAADSSSAIEPAMKEKADAIPASWSADGKWLAYVVFGDGHFQIWIRPMSGEGGPKPFLESQQFSYTHATFSPDGRWIAYQSNESGAAEVYVQAFPGPGEKHSISNGGGGQPAWNPNGRELFYTARADGNKQKMMAVDITPGVLFKAGTPHLLFEGPWQSSNPVRDYDITPDGQHFIMARQEEFPDQKVTRLNVVLNWFDELKKRAPRAADK